MPGEEEPAGSKVRTGQDPLLSAGRSHRDSGSTLHRAVRLKG